LYRIAPSPANTTGRRLRLRRRRGDQRPVDGPVVQDREDLAALRVNPGSHQAGITGVAERMTADCLERGHRYYCKAARERQALDGRNPHPQSGEGSWTRDDRQQADVVERNARGVERASEV
jgi:hypothetical protein